MIDNFMGPLDELEYRRHQREGAIGGSGLVKIRRLSVAHYLADLEKMASRPAVGFGNVVHTAALEPDQFAARYYVKPEIIKADVPEPWKVERPEVTKLDGLWRVGDGPGEYATKTNAAAAAKAVSGWTIDGETFYPTRKALAEQCGGLLPWTLSGDGPQPSFRTREEAGQHLRELAGDKQAISIADMLRCDEIVRALRAHPVAGPLLDGAECEEVVLWHDAEHGLDCSGKLDARRALDTLLGGELLPGVGEVGQQVGIDLKTTGKLAQPDKLARMCHDAGWHVQAAHYVAGVAACGVELCAWINIVVETEAPYGVAVVVLDDDYLSLGRYERGQALAKVKAWRETGEARGYDPAPVVVSPPAWALPLEVEGRDFVEWAQEHRDAVLAEKVERAQAEVDDARDALADTLEWLSRVSLEAAQAARGGDYGRAAELADQTLPIRRQAAEMDEIVRTRQRRLRELTAKGAR